jgi:uncharacterized protein (TIGR00369 family)
MTESGAATRERLVRWVDPQELAARIRGMSGLECLTAIIEKRLAPPPSLELLGLVIDEAKEGRVIMSMAPAEEHYNAAGTVHGGIISTLLDSAMGNVVHSTLPVGRGYTTLEIKVNYLRAVTPATGRVRAEAATVHVGRQTAMAQARLLDAAGRLYAQASATCLVFDLPADRATSA